MPKVVPEYKEEARTRILEGARRVFAEKGYHEATMDELAKQLGVSKGALYLYYPSKEDLFEAMCRSSPTAFKDILYSMFSPSENPLDSATKFFDAMMGRFGPNPKLDLEILLEASRNSSMKRILRQNQEEYAKALAGFLEGLKAMRVIDESLELLPLAYSLIALWNGLETLMVAGLPVAEAKQAWLESFKAMFLHNRTHIEALNAGRMRRKTS